MVWNMTSKSWPLESSIMYIYGGRTMGLSDFWAPEWVMEIGFWWTCNHIMTWMRHQFTQKSVSPMVLPQQMFMMEDFRGQFEGNFVQYYLWNGTSEVIMYNMELGIYTCTYPPKCGSHMFLSWLFTGLSWRNRAWRWAFGPLWKEKYNGPVTLTTVAMVIKKLSNGSDIDLMVTKLCIWCLLNHTNLLAENEQNLPHGFRDRPLATAWQPTSKWDSGG